MNDLHNEYSLGNTETQPLLRPGSKIPANKLCLGTVLVVMTITWCTLDTWNHEVSGSLFGVQQVKNLKVDQSTGDLKAVIQKFEYPLTLAFIQFLFMGLLFLCMWRLTTTDVSRDLAKVHPTSIKWGGMVTTHVFSTFFLQSLIMPRQMMSLGIFAASRAIEVPTASFLRSKTLSVQCGGHSPTTSMCMFVAVAMMYYSYTQIEECLCIWSGYGVSLAGPPLFIIYALVLTLPAANAVCQEAVLVDHETHPFLILALQNIAATALFLPVLFFAHTVGLENLVSALQITFGNREIYMLTLWLCVQMAATSAVWIGMIYMVDSFWAVSFRSARVVFWWIKELVLFYIFSDTLLSIARPNASLWSFVMLCGVCLATMAMVHHQRNYVNEIKDKDQQFMHKQFPDFKAV